MSARQWIGMMAAAAIASATWSAGAQMFIYPAQGQSPEQQNRDHGECHVWAVQASGFDPANPQAASSGAASPGPGTPAGAVVGGAARGAARGAVGGAIGGNAGRGAAIGAATGGLIGGMRRNDQHRHQAQAQQRQQAAVAQAHESFHRAFAACMRGRGYTVN